MDMDGQKKSTYMATQRVKVQENVIICTGFNRATHFLGQSLSGVVVYT